MDTPKQVRTGHDPKTGRFLPGHCGNRRGRPRGFDLRRVAEFEALLEGIDLEKALWVVLKRMIHKAAAGDVQAAKLVFDKLGTDQERGPLVNIDIGQVNEGTGPPMPTGEELGVYLREVEKLASEISAGTGAVPRIEAEIGEPEDEPEPSPHGLEYEQTAGVHTSRITVENAIVDDLLS